MAALTFTGIPNLPVDGVLEPDGQKTCNERPVYATKDASVMLWWVGGEWFVGPADELGEMSGYISCPTEALTPDGLDEWTKPDPSDGEWVLVPGLRLVPGADLKEMAEKPRPPPLLTWCIWSVRRPTGRSATI